MWLDVPASHWQLYWCFLATQMSMTGNHIGIHGPCCRQGPYWSECPALPPETMVISMVQSTSWSLVWVCVPTAARSHVHGLSCFWKPSGGSWSMLLLTVKSKEATFQGYQCLQAQLRGRDIESFCDISPQKKRNSLDRKSPKRSLKKWYRDAEVWFSTKEASGVVGEALSCDWSRGRPLRVWSCSSEYG